MPKQKLNSLTLIPDEKIIGKIYLIRNRKVMLDSDLAILYGVETGVLNQAVKRNIKRFPADFMFKLTREEMKIWKSQIVISNYDLSLKSQFVTLKKGRGQHSKYLPLVFTEQGVAMLSSVLHSDRAIQVNIQIMRTFTKLREMMATHKELREKIEKMEQKYDKKFKVIFDVIKKLLTTDKEEKTRRLGFRIK